MFILKNKILILKNQKKNTIIKTYIILVNKIILNKECKY